MTAEDRAAGAGGWLVYLVRCSDGSLYCGCTTDMNRRLAQHNGLLAGGARFTAARRPVTLCAAAPCACRSEALRLEARIKKLPAAAKIRALESAASAKGPNAGAPTPSSRTGIQAS